MTGVHTSARAITRPGKAETVTARRAPSRIPLWIALGDRRRQCRVDRLAVVGRRQRHARAQHGRLPRQHRAHHRAARRVLGAAPGSVARANPLGRALGRLRSPHRLAPLERARLPLPRARPCRLLGLGLRGARQAAAVDGDLADADGRHLSGHDHRDDRHLLADRRRRQLGRRRAAPCALRGLVRDPSHRLRVDRARVVPPDPDGQRARRSTASPPTTGAASTSQRWPCSSGYRVLVPFVNAFRYRLRVADVVDEGAGVVSLRIEGRGLDRLQRPGRSVLPLALPQPRPLVGVAPVLAVGRARRTLVYGSRSRISATSRIGRARSGPARASSPRGRSASSPTPCGTATRWR